jgi:hypothetical protein
MAWRKFTLSNTNTCYYQYNEYKHTVVVATVKEEDAATYPEHRNIYDTYYMAINGRKLTK